MNKTAENILPLPVAQPEKPAARTAPARFKIQEFTNPRTGSVSWRVAGIKRDRTRVRANFTDLQAAQCKQIELETEFLKGNVETTIRATRLSAEQVQLAEVAFIKLGDDWQRILDAVDDWKRAGSHHAVAVESPRIDEAFTKFEEWLKTADFRKRTKDNLRVRVKVFVNSIPNMRVVDVTADTVFNYLEKRGVARASKDNDRRALSRFFSWCMVRPQQWLRTNPARKETRERKSTNGHDPAVLSVKECEKILKAAQRHGLAPYVAVCLFGGLRPLEAARLNWKATNLKDREIRLEGNQTKTGHPRVVVIDNTLAAWLSAYKNKPFFPPNWRKKFDAVKRAAGFAGRTAVSKNTDLKPWPVDVLRHTAISHYFRKTGSYGQTAEQFGNSEAIIKAHYQGRVSTDDTNAFYALRPAKKGGRK